MQWLHQGMQAGSTDMPVPDATAAVLDRWQRFNATKVLWFLVGTSYDIFTHAAIAGLLVHQLQA
jgi:hypothetical protein